MSSARAGQWSWHLWKMVILTLTGNMCHYRYEVLISVLQVEVMSRVCPILVGPTNS